MIIITVLSFVTADPPGQAFISKDTEMVVKGQAITLTCSVDEPGRPEATKYIWQRGGHVVNYVNSFNWTIDPVTLETEANISCVAVNEVGQGSPDFINIQVIGRDTSFFHMHHPSFGFGSQEDTHKIRYWSVTFQV